MRSQPSTAHDTPSKPGGAPSVERGFELRRPIAAEVLDRVDLHAVVQHDLQEGVLRELTRDGDRDRTATDDVGDLAGMGVAAAVGAQVGDDHHVDCAARRACPGR